MDEINKILDRVENYYTMKYGMDFDKNEKPMSIEEAKQAIIDLICETAEEAKPEFSGCVDCSDISVKVFQDNLINIVRGK